METIRRAMEKAHITGAGSLIFEQPERSEVGSSGVGKGVFNEETDVLELDTNTLVANRIIAWDKGDARTNSVDRLRTKVLIEMKQRGWRTLGVVSPTQGCGKTTLAINLAMSMAQQTVPEVLLLDFDLRRPRVAEYLGVHPSNDLPGFLEGRTPLTAYRVSAGDVRFRVFVTLGSRRNSTELLGSPKVELLMRRLTKDAGSGVAIFDFPPLLTTDDALAVLPRIDCVLAVVGENITKKAEIKEFYKQLDRCNVIGTVFNMSRGPQDDYY